MMYRLHTCTSYIDVTANGVAARADRGRNLGALLKRNHSAK